MELNNKIVLITGYSGGLGTFVTNAFVEAGARVVGVARNIPKSDLPRERLSAMPAELSNSESARRLVEAVAAAIPVDAGA